MDFPSASETHHQELPLVHHLVAVCIKHIEGNLKASMGLWKTERKSHIVSVDERLCPCARGPEITQDEVIVRPDRVEATQVDISMESELFLYSSLTIVYRLIYKLDTH